MRNSITHYTYKVWENSVLCFYIGLCVCEPKLYGAGHYHLTQSQSLLRDGGTRVGQVQVLHDLPVQHLREANPGPRQVNLPACASQGSQYVL